MPRIVQLVKIPSAIIAHQTADVASLAPERLPSEILPSILECLPVQSRVPFVLASKTVGCSSFGAATCFDLDNITTAHAQSLIEDDFLPMTLFPFTQWDCDLDIMVTLPPGSCSSRKCLRCDRYL